MNARRVLSGILVVQIVTMLVLAFLALPQQQFAYILTDIIAAVILGAVLAAHLWGWRWSAHATQLLNLAAFILGASIASEASRDVLSFAIIGPSILAAILLPWYWCIGVYLVNVAVLALLWQGQGVLFDPVIFTFATTQAIAVTIAAIVLGKAQRDAEANAHRAEEALIRTEHQAQELARHASDLEQQNEQQRQLLDLVSTLEIPAVSLADGVLLAPLVGHLDSRRAQMLTSRLLLAINAQRAQLVILDIAGVSTIDTSIARALLDTTQAVRLLGCKVIITGISASVAVTMTHLGINLAGIATARTPQEALVSYVARMSSQHSAASNGNGVLNSLN